jgi:hypothetical protein
LAKARSKLEHALLTGGLICPRFPSRAAGSAESQNTTKEKKCQSEYRSCFCWRRSWQHSCPVAPTCLAQRHAAVIGRATGILVLREAAISINVLYSVSIVVARGLAFNFHQSHTGGGRDRTRWAWRWIPSASFLLDPSGHRLAFVARGQRHPTKAARRQPR